MGDDVILKWLCAPSSDRGLYTPSRRGGWEFEPYSTTASRVTNTANNLLIHGRPGSKVAIVASEPRLFVSAFFGALAAGMTPVPIAVPQAFQHRDAHVSNMRAIFGVALPAIVLADQSSYAAIGEAMPSSCRPTILDAAGAHDCPGSGWGAAHRPEIALLQFTSGSTGSPKGVQVTASNLEANVKAIQQWLSWSPADIFASWLPLHHDMGLVGAMITSVVTGTDLYLMTPKEFLRNPLMWLECFGRHGATITTAPSFGYEYVAKRVNAESVCEHDYTRWRVAILGGERVATQSISKFHSLVADRGFDAKALTGAYGLAESTLAVTGVVPGTGTKLVQLAPEHTTHGSTVAVTRRGTLGLDGHCGAGWLASSGIPVDSANVAVVDPDGHPVATEILGEIQISGPSLARGYLRPNSETEAFDPLGALTGDTGVFIDDELFVVGRVADAMKVRGALLHAEDVEAEIASIHADHPLRNAVSFGMHHGNDIATAFVEHATDAKLVEKIVAKVAVLTANSAEILVLEVSRGSISRTTSGKPRRRLLWEKLVRGEFPASQFVYGHLLSPARVGVRQPQDAELHFDEGSVTLTAPDRLYELWETRNWSIKSLRVQDDIGAFKALKPFAAATIIDSLVDFSVGENAVTTTLGAILEGTSDHDSQIYLCTQIADEARHTRFFRNYLEQVANIDPDKSAENSAYGRYFEPTLRAVTSAVSKAATASSADWYRALVHYHLLTEGLLAAPGLRRLRSIASSQGLNSLVSGLANVSRDEGRHLTFGLWAASNGVATGYSDIIEDAYVSGIHTAVRTLVDPDRPIHTPIFRTAANAQVTDLRRTWDDTKKRMHQHLTFIGLEKSIPRANDAWDDAFLAAFMSYQKTSGKHHPAN